VFVDDVEVQLTPTEYTVLTTLIEQAGKVVTNRQLQLMIGGSREEDGTRQLRAAIHQLRRKLDADPESPAYLRAEPGIGYRLHVD
jgi:two-component system KDP operon response regulator KdpE